jgi:DNA/RNA-binding domain of Phe-tRNA-synthetase-like protein
MNIDITPTWQEKYPGAHIGLLLVRNINNQSPSDFLEQNKRSREAHLRSKYEGYSRADLQAIETMQAYRLYYKAFRKTYHVQLQLESILFSGKDLPSVNPLVDAAFMAEMETLILTASHDVAKLTPPVFIDIAQENEDFNMLSGQTAALKAGDMIMRDAHGVVCTVIYGQDRRTAISKKTRQAIYVCYVPAGIQTGDIDVHLEMIEKNIALFSSQVEIGYRIILPR